MILTKDPQALLPMVLKSVCGWLRAVAGHIVFHVQLPPKQYPVGGPRLCSSDCLHECSLPGVIDAKACEIKRRHLDRICQPPSQGIVAERRFWRKLLEQCLGSDRIAHPRVTPRTTQKHIAIVCRHAKSLHALRAGLWHRRPAIAGDRFLPLHDLGHNPGSHGNDRRIPPQMPPPGIAQSRKDALPQQPTLQQFRGAQVGLVLQLKVGIGGMALHHGDDVLQSILGDSEAAQPSHGARHFDGGDPYLDVGSGIGTSIWRRQFVQRSATVLGGHHGEQARPGANVQHVQCIAPVPHDVGRRPPRRLFDGPVVQLIP